MRNHAQAICSAASAPGAPVASFAHWLVWTGTYVNCQARVTPVDCQCAGPGGLCTTAQGAQGLKIRRKAWKIAAVILALLIAAIAIGTPLSPPGTVQRSMALCGAILSVGYIGLLLYLYVDWKRQ